MEALTYPGMPVRVHGEIADIEHVFRPASNGIYDGDPIDFGFRAPWLERAVFAARLTTPFSEVTLNDVIQFGIDLEVRPGLWQTLVVFPGYKAPAGDGTAAVGNKTADWMATVGPVEVAAELAPAVVSAGFSVGVGTVADAVVNNIPICGRIRPTIRVNTAYHGGTGHNVRMTLYAEGYARPQDFDGWRSER